ncbi:glycosyltransferase [Vulcanisaeta thermophila]|uniref:glycosyltransferase n=1 Tax=Vulcanisaeta thermophila TaxID=867917 RepID=UPI00350E4BB7
MVCASAAVALDGLGFEPILTGTFRFDPRAYVDWYGIDISKYGVEVLMPLGIKAFGLWSRLFVWRPALRVLQRVGAGPLFTDEPAYKPLLGFRRRGLRIIEYIHFPLEVYVREEFQRMGLSGGEDPYIRERYGRFPLNIYWGAFTRLLPRYLRDNPFNAADLVLTNSQWTAEVARVVYGEKPTVLNPPIPPNTHLVTEPRPFSERLPLIVMLGRFSEEKRYHWVLGELMPRLLREVPNAKLVIFGGATTRTQLSYVGRVEGIARRVGLRVEVLQGDVTGKLGGDAQVLLRLNAPRDEINRVMDMARAFLHATVNEHWGIAIAEAMARGLPIIVHRSGGAWTDLALEGQVGLGYVGVDDAVESLAKLLTDGKSWGYYSGKSLERVRDIAFDNFVSRLMELVKRVI